MEHPLDSSNSSVSGAPATVPGVTPVGSKQWWLEQFTSALPDDGVILELCAGPDARSPNAEGAGSGLRKHAVDVADFCRSAGSAPARAGSGEPAIPPRQFDGIIAWDSLWKLRTDLQRRSFAAIDRYVARAGILLFTSGSMPTHVAASIDGREERYESLDEREYEHLLARHGFRLLRHTVDDPDYGGYAVWLAARVGA